MFDTLNARIGQLAEQHPHKLAIAFKSERLSYAELRQRVLRGARILTDLGVKRGDRVMFSAVSKPEMAVTYLAIQYVGAAAVFADKAGTPENLAFIYEDTGAVLLITDKNMKEFADGCNTYSLKTFYEGTQEDPADGQIPEYMFPEGTDLADMIYTSGTTGRPKGVMLSYRAVFNILMNTWEGVGMREDDRVLIPLPLHHSFALREMRAALYHGATVILQNGFTFAKEIENNIAEFGCTGIILVPATVGTVEKQMQERFPEIMRSFRYIEVGAGSLSIAQKLRLSSELPDTRIVNTWGSSETGGAIFLDVHRVAGDPDKISSIGVPVTNVEVKTLDSEGRDLVSSREVPGRMALKGGMEMSGYWHRPELNEETFRDGWLLTSDMVYIEDGYVFMLGRIDDIINVGGEKVSPVEVENIASQFEDMDECACVGVPDKEGILGSVPVLFVVEKRSFEDKDLTRFLSGRMEKYKLPAHYVRIPELPRNAMKKVNRRALREIWDLQEGL
ncbi:MAG: acyl--CoA ligase [Firmicutes bacterium]|nr:acyl--CoA ligase [Bacillota bacterium]